MRRMLLTAALVAGLSSIGAQLLTAGAGATATSTRTIDRTVLCATVLQAGLRKLTVYATAATSGQEEITGEKQLPRVSLSSGSFGPDVWGSGITAGGLVGRHKGSATFAISRESCSSTRTRVPLSERGLVGGAASPFGDSYECYPPRRILLRVRATFRSPTALRRTADRFWTPTPVERGYLAARTLSGKPLIFGEIHQSGAARLFVAPGCIPE
jgi:hypothetical protein